jgi:hypothetical protein
VLVSTVATLIPKDNIAFLILDFFVDHLPNRIRIRIRTGAPGAEVKLLPLLARDVRAGARGFGELERVFWFADLDEDGVTAHFAGRMGFDAMR